MDSFRRGANAAFAAFAGLDTAAFAGSGLEQQVRTSSMFIGFSFGQFGRSEGADAGVRSSLQSGR